ncbi:hypothetical protein LguiB_020336 [Lonicera macranthoides]
MEVVELELDFGENFGSSAKLEEAVCNHGFFMMAPNDWNPLTKTLTRPLRLDDSITSAIVSVSHDGANPNSLREMKVLRSATGRRETRGRFPATGCLALRLCGFVHRRRPCVVSATKDIDDEGYAVGST